MYGLLFGALKRRMCVCVHVCVCVPYGKSVCRELVIYIYSVCVYIYIYIYIASSDRPISKRETSRERAKERDQVQGTNFAFNGLKAQISKLCALKSSPYTDFISQMYWQCLLRICTWLKAT